MNFLIICIDGRFIQIDIKEIYPSIIEETLNEAISFASEYTTVTAKTIHIIKHSWKTYFT